MFAQTTLWQLLIPYLLGVASGAIVIGAVGASRIARLSHENARLRAGLSHAVTQVVAAPVRAGRRWAALALAVVAALSIAPAVQAQQQTAAAGDARDDNALAYCRNIANSASDARFARQAAALAAMEKEIDSRIAALEAKRAEYQDWLQRREAFLKKADEALISVISQMRPDAAAAQISVMQDEAAAAILAKLNPRSASAILNEMEPARAATLTNTMVGISRRAQAQAEGRS
ncbi:MULTISPECIES: MotE family protein [Azorhizobium]|nr:MULTISPECIES: MotE family protein [Azorhizobium]TDT88897.1 flagellar motility protein MotE (MotC chaperone) [Azorhizobium sp. AG788]